MTLQLEAKVVWGEDVLSVAYMAPKALVRVRDLALPLPLSGGPLRDGDRVVARMTKHGCEVCVPELELEQCTLHISLVQREAIPSLRGGHDPRPFGGFALAAAAHAALLVLAFASRATAAESEQEAFEQLMKYSARADARVRDEVVPASSTTPDETALAAAKKDEGAAGNPARTDDGGRRRKTLGEIPTKSVPGEEASFGIITLIAGDHAGSSAFEKPDGEGAMGNIFAVMIDDAAGAGGLGLSGDGEGGGGRGAAVPLERIGTGTSQGFGSCHCGIRQTYSVRSPGYGFDETGVNGRLPPETIQRIVRQSFGRFRLCYERGLASDPQMAGRVEVKFVIDREGEVSMASVTERSLGQRSLAEDEVAACVARTFHSLSFPKPTGGIVTVTYPIVFEKT